MISLIEKFLIEFCRGKGWKGVHDWTCHMPPLPLWDY